jgi:hypothetical protein
MRLLWIVCLSAAASFPAVAGGCAVEGLRIRWQADYCMFKVGSDDIITADPCMRADSKRHYRNDCEAKKYYKLQICRMTGNGSKQSRAQCFKDKSAVGPTVRNGGIGG